MRRSGSGSQAKVLDLWVHRGGLQGVSWESGNLLGLHSYRAQREVLCTWMAEQTIPGSCRAVEEVPQGLRRLRSVLSPDGFPRLKQDPEIDQRPGVHQINPGEHQLVAAEQVMGRTRVGMREPSVGHYKGCQ